MNTKSTHRSGTFSLAFALIISALLAFSWQSRAQTNMNLNAAQVAPVYSISNMFLINVGGILANDPIVPGTFDYTVGTNHAGNVILPAGVSKSRYVSFGFTVANTNTVACTYVATVQGSTGFGDWVSLTPVLPVTTVTTNMGASWNTNNVVGTNATYDVGGLVLFRLKSVVDPEAATTNAQVGFSFSSKPGI